MSDPLATIPLSAIRVFEAAARLRSFTRAAQELGMTQAAVSWQVKALERRLAQPLFRRLPREVALTPAGERLARAATDAMLVLRGALTDISEADEGVLAITTLNSFAMLWLSQRLGAFQVAHPRIAVRLDTEARVIDLLREEADVGIRTGRTGEWPGLESIRLFPSAQTVLASPQALANLGEPVTPEAMLRTVRAGTDAEWSAWFSAAGVTATGPETPGSPRFVADTQILEVAGAIAGGGVALGSPVLFAPDIAAGRLVQPFEIYVRPKGEYWLVYPRDRRRTPKIAAYRDWILAQVDADPAAQRLIAAARRDEP